MRIRIAASLLVGLPLLVAFTGCTGFERRPSANSPEQLLADARGPEENKKLYTDLIRELIDQDRLYAAYAHLQEQERSFGDSQELQLLRAEIERKLGRIVEAEANYKALLNTPYEGYAQHGLGLIYAQQNLELGTQYLRRAVKLRPTDARIRNDLGYALMRQGKLSEARLHLATAYQLDNGSSLSRNNYILVQLLDGDEKGARHIAQRSQIPPNEMALLKRQAAQFNQAGQKTSPRASVTAAGERLVVGGGGG